VKSVRTQVVIIGAGPAGLLLGHLLQREGVDTVILETRSLDYVQQRVRAGVIEYGIANFLEESGVGSRMRAEGSSITVSSFVSTACRTASPSASFTTVAPLPSTDNKKS